MLLSNLDQRIKDGQKRLEHLISSLAEKKKKSILIVDDDIFVIRTITSLIHELGEEEFQVEAATGGEEGIEFIRQKDFDLVLLDIRMPIVSGIEVMKRVKEFKPRTNFIIITGYGDSSLLDELLQMGAITVMLKPVTIEDITKILRKV